MKFTFLIYVSFFYSCSLKKHKEVVRAFYYWKSVYAPGKYEKEVMSKLHVNSLYMKFFDVIWDERTKSAIPVAQINIKDSSYRKFNITPVVFITNEALLNIDPTNIDSLSNLTCGLVIKIIEQNQIRPPSEIQFDCDWTRATKEKYFRFLRIARLYLSKSSVSKFVLSSTVRLYQYKYANKTGVPPVDKGLLMCYNMGNLKNPETKNSILEASELKKYISSSNAYPLDLDIALPIFDWKVLYHNRRYAGLVKGLSSSRLMNDPYISVKDGKFNFLKDTVVDHYSFRKGDMLRDEQSDYNEIIRSCDVIDPKLKGDKTTIILYHLDSLTLSKYPIDALENIFDCFR